MTGIRQITIYIILGFLATGCFNKNNIQDIVVVDVNGQKLTASSFAEKLAKKLKTFDVLRAKDAQTINRVKNEVINEFIHESIIVQWASTQNITVSPQEVEEQIEQLQHIYPNDMSFRQSLIEISKPIDLLKKDIHKRLLEKKVFKTLHQNISQPTTEDLVSYYNTHKSLFKQTEKVYIQHFLFETRNLAQGAYQQIKSSSFSTNIGSKNLQSSKIWVEKGVLDIFDRAFIMKKGVWSDILKSPYGYHIYRVLKKTNQQWAFQEVKGKIYKSLIANREQAVYSSWLEEQVRDLKVFRNDQAISSLQIETIGEH